MAGLAPCPEAVAEHESQCSPEHGFVGLLQARLLIEGQDFVRRGQLPVGAREETLDLRPVNVVGLQFVHVEQLTKRAYSAIHCPGKHLFGSGATRIHGAIKPCN